MTHREAASGHVMLLFQPSPLKQIQKMLAGNMLGLVLHELKESSYSLSGS